MKAIFDALRTLFAVMFGSEKPSVPKPVQKPSLSGVTIEAIADDIVAREGGFVNDPDDPGGATKHGVTIGALRRLGYDLNGDGKVDTEDVKLIDRDLAQTIFLDHYFHGPRIDELPKPLHDTVFDMYVNAGANAVRILQRLLRELTGVDLAIDGVIGPETLEAARVAYAKGGEDIRNAYGVARRDYYYDLADRRPALRKYAQRRDGGKGGWITRAEEFLDQRYRLTDAQHKARTTRWA